MRDIFLESKTYLAAAAVAAQANFQSKGFRQKDIRFLLSLFLNWMDISTKGLDESFHNTQISRYLNHLVKKGFAVHYHNESRPVYHLTRAGVLELLGQLTKMPAPLDEFFFIHYFVKTYRARIEQLLQIEGAPLPNSFRIEVEALLDIKHIVNMQIRHVKTEIKKLEERTLETQGAADLSVRLLRQGADVESIVKTVASQFPYDLNSVKPMSELLREVPVEFRIQELTSGNVSRVNSLWKPLSLYLKSYLMLLEELQAP